MVVIDPVDAGEDKGKDVDGEGRKEGEEAGEPVPLGDL